MILLNHGVFTFADTAQESYERMIRLVSLAEDYLEREAPPAAAQERPGDRAPAGRRIEIAELRGRIAAAAGFPVVLERHADPKSLDFARRADVASISQQGPATPDHVVRTKRLPLVGRDVDAYVDAYRAYFEEHSRGRELRRSTRRRGSSSTPSSASARPAAPHAPPASQPTSIGTRST